MARVYDAVLSIPGMSKTMKVDLKALRTSDHANHENFIANNYHKCVKYLSDFGYIQYEPPFRKTRRVSCTSLKSRVTRRIINKKMKARRGLLLS